jgi:signal transduction histidine kinase
MITLNILAVDDEPRLLNIIKHSLDNYQISATDINAEIDFRVETVTTGQAAVDAIKARAPDILLIEYKLPDFTGLEVLKRTKAISGDMLTIMITAYAFIETASAATKLGAYDFLFKPFTPGNLRNTVKNTAIHTVLSRSARELENKKRHGKFEFNRVLGHELKAPLSATAGYLFLLRDHTLGNDLDKYDDLVKRSLIRIDQMEKLILDLLDITRLESGGKNRVLEEIDLVGAARQSIERAEQEAASRGIIISLSSPERLPIMADQVEISMIFNNLITNAIKYNQDRGKVNITISRTGFRINISVSDTGIGISKEGINKLFREFVRLKDKRTENIPGSGLGLSILKQLADLYHGSIEVESKLNQGSTFTVHLIDRKNKTIDQSVAQ